MAASNENLSVSMAHKKACKCLPLQACANWRLLNDTFPSSSTSSISATVKSLGAIRFGF